MLVMERESLPFSTSLFYINQVRFPCFLLLPHSFGCDRLYLLPVNKTSWSQIIKSWIPSLIFDLVHMFPLSMGFRRC